MQYLIFPYLASSRCIWHWTMKIVMGGRNSCAQEMQKSCSGRAPQCAGAFRVPSLCLSQDSPSTDWPKYTVLSSVAHHEKVIHASQAAHCQIYWWISIWAVLMFVHQFWFYSAACNRLKVRTFLNVTSRYIKIHLSIAIRVARGWPWYTVLHLHGSPKAANQHLQGQPDAQRSVVAEAFKSHSPASTTFPLFPPSLHPSLELHSTITHWNFKALPIPVLPCLAPPHHLASSPA